MNRLLVLSLLCCTYINLIAQEYYLDKENGRYRTIKKFEYVPNELYGDSIPPVVYDYMSKVPEYPGGLKAMDKFMIENFVFPPETWQKWKEFGMARRMNGWTFCGYCVVRKDGKAIAVQSTEDTGHIFANEFARVVSLMPRWKPAELNGQEVDVFFEITTNLIHPKYSLPYSAVPLVRKAKKMAKSIDKKYSCGVDKPMADSVASELLSIHRTGWDEAETSICGARLLATLGRHSEAVGMLESMLGTYHKIGFREFPDTITGRCMRDSYFTEGRYSARTELRAAVMLAAIQCMSGNADSSRVGCDRAIEFIDLLLVEGMGKSELSASEIQLLNDLSQEKAMIVDKTRSQSVHLNPSDRFDIEREMILGDRNREIDKRISEGKISNARVIQITNQLNSFLKERQDRDADRNTVRLYQLRAMLIGMRDGVEAEREYVSQLASGELTGKKVARKLAEWSKKVSLPVLEDRRHLLESIVLFAPLNVDGTRDEAAREASKTFYEHRKELEKVYPLKWLDK